MTEQKNALGQTLTPAASLTGQRLFALGLVLFGVLSCFFTSSIQTSLPQFARLMRMGLTGVSAVVMAVKLGLFTPLTRKETVAVGAVLALAALLGFTSKDFWLPATLLVVAAGKGTEPQKGLKIFTIVATGSLLLAEALHPFGLVPWMLVGSRAYDFGYGYYNGFAGRLFGVYLAWLVLLFPKIKWWGWVLAGAVPPAMLLLTTSRGGTMGCAAAFVLLLGYRLLPKLFHTKAMKGLLLCFGAGIWGLSLYGMVFYDEHSRFWVFLDKLNPMRLPYGHAAFMKNGLRLLGGFPVDTGASDCVDNAYMAFAINKGVVGAALLFVVFMGFLWLLLREDKLVPALALCAVLLYGMPENRIINLYVNPLLLMLPEVLWPTTPKKPTES